jgi:hypothetical protein
VKHDQAYATEIQKAVVDQGGGGWSAGDASTVGGGSAQPKIGTTVTTKDEVEGKTESGTVPITTGSVVFAEEVVRTGQTGKAQLLFADRTNLSIAPVTEIRLDKFVYDPNGTSGNVVVVATEGAFRFITGVQAHENYTIKTPYATMGVRGTEFNVLIRPDEEQIQLVTGGLVVTSISGVVTTLSTPSTISVDSQGNTQTLPATNQPLVNFADMGPALTNLSFADALDSFTAVTGNQNTTGANSVGGGGGGAGGGGGGTSNPSPSAASRSGSPH